ncbi:MAG TPA: hypothetical protein PKE63_05260, partial [Lacibacter sp.]|nr:hypothetical protein [Lacibacter sp.]
FERPVCLRCKNFRAANNIAIHSLHPFFWMAAGIVKTVTVYVLHTSFSAANRRIPVYFATGVRIGRGSGKKCRLGKPPPG